MEIIRNGISEVFTPLIYQIIITVTAFLISFEVLDI